MVCRPRARRRRRGRCRHARAGDPGGDAAAGGRQDVSRGPGGGAARAGVGGAEPALTDQAGHFRDVYNPLALHLMLAGFARRFESLPLAIWSRCQAALAGAVLPARAVERIAGGNFPVEQTAADPLARRCASPSPRQLEAGTWTSNSSTAWCDILSRSGQGRRAASANTERVARRLDVPRTGRPARSGEPGAGPQAHGLGEARRGNRRLSSGQHPARPHDQPALGPLRVSLDRPHAELRGAAGARPGGAGGRRAGPGGGSTCWRTRPTRWAFCSLRTTKDEAFNRRGRRERRDN